MPFLGRFVPKRNYLSIACYDSLCSWATPESENCLHAAEGGETGGELRDDSL